MLIAPIEKKGAKPHIMQTTKYVNFKKRPVIKNFMDLGGVFNA